MDVFRTDLLFGPLVATFILGFFSFVLLAWYSTRNHDYWKKQGVPFVNTLPFLGSVWQSIRTSMHEADLKRFYDLGRIYGHFEGTRPLLSVADAKILREILVKDFHNFPNRRIFSTGDKIFDKMVSILTGEDWKRVRTIITPTFTTGRIKRMLSIFKDCSNSVIANFKKTVEDGKPVDCKRIYGAYTMDVIASSAFSTKLDSHNDPDNAFVQTARKVFTRNISWRFVLFLLAPSFMKFFRISVFDPNVMQFFTDATAQIIEERRRTGKTRNDFLQLLLDTAKEVSSDLKEDGVEQEDITSNYGEETSRLQGFKGVTNKNLSMDELIAQCVIFFIAGYDTTASTLSFASYLLALNPHVQDKLRAEVDDVLKETDGELTYEALQSMKYLDNVISETLRVFPPAVRTERVAEADYELADTGIKITKGMIVTIPVYSMHRDPEYFPEPEKFNPDRFTPEERAKRDQFAYMPFGAGPRNCVGMRFALVEIKVCLANVIATFKIKKHPKTKIPLDFYVGQGLLQPKEIIVEFEPRKDGPMLK